MDTDNRAVVKVWGRGSLQEVNGGKGDIFSSFNNKELLNEK